MPEPRSRTSLITASATVDIDFMVCVASIHRPSPSRGRQQHARHYSAASRSRASAGLSASARRASSRRRRVSSPVVRLASSRSHSAISSSTLATMRRCSARGGTGIGYARTVDMFTRGAAPPVVRAFAMSVMKGELRTISKKSALVSVPARMSISRWPRHNRTPFGTRQAIPKIPPSRL